MGTIRDDISSAHNGVAVDISSTDATLTSGCRGLYVGGTGDIIINFPDSTVSITFKNVPVGIFPVQVGKVIKTGTTATLMIALF